jgi:membrane protease YdiL (CAAX protease family)
VNRFLSFARSVLPADLSQLLFVFGSVFLFIAPQLQWWPAQISNVSRFALLTPDNELHRFRIGWIVFLGLTIWPIRLAGIAGLFFCFRSVGHSVCRVFFLVCVPAFAGIILICARFLSLVNGPYSVLDSTGLAVHNSAWFFAMSWKLGTGLHFAVVGLILVSIYLSRLAFGVSVLPLWLPSERKESLNKAEIEPWRRIEIFLWISIACMNLLASVVIGLTWTFPYAFFGTLRFGESGWFLNLQGAIITGLLAGFAAWAVGADRWRSLRESLCVPGPQELALGLLFPLGISWLIPLGTYLHDRVFWAARDFGRSSAPSFVSYFSFPEPRLFLLLFAALFEEIIWRGFLQPRFIRRYGLYRGIFLVAVVWGAFHFGSDFRAHLSDTDVLLAMLSRLVTCVALGFVFGWLTLRTGSVLPAALAHGVYNMFLFTSAEHFYPGMGVIRQALWCLLAYLLFRYWLPQTDNEALASATPTSPEPTS